MITYLHIVKIGASLRRYSFGFDNVHRRTRTNDLNRTITSITNTKHSSNNRTTSSMDGCFKGVVKVLQILGSVLTLKIHAHRIRDRSMNVNFHEIRNLQVEMQSFP